MYDKGSPLGHFQADNSGLLHWQCSQIWMVPVDHAAADAIAKCPSGPAWFWFNETPAPIIRGDTATSLLARWYDWRRAFQADPRALLECLTRMLPGKYPASGGGK